ncbi:alpha/beta hydrolase [Leptodesmis sp.]|uniref:alpha/beta hydrolase n=1 Tax=Leptodesmis sp. TaxID=3100501 RepID=UPI004053551D
MIQISQIGLRRFLEIVTAAIATVTSFLLLAPPGRAANEVVFRYGIFRRRLAVAELTNFAKTGEQSRVLQKYLETTNSNAESIRQILNQPVDVDRSTLNVALKNPAANLLLDELGHIIQTPDNKIQGNKEALREAVLASASKDNQFTLLEVIQNYPADEIHLDVKRAIKTYNTVSKFQKPVEGALGQINQVRQMLKDRGINLPDFLR